MQESYVGLVRDLSDSYCTVSLARFLICFSLLLLPTTLMGATLPILAKPCVGARERVGKRIGYLYAINTVGASLGCVATGFLLVEALGVARTHGLAIALNLAVATVAVSMHFRGLSASQSALALSRSVASRANRQVGVSEIAYREDSCRGGLGWPPQQ